MRTAISFNNLVDAAYNLPLDEKIEFINLLELNIAKIRREEISANYKHGLTGDTREFPCDVKDFFAGCITLDESKEKVISRLREKYGNV